MEGRSGKEHSGRETWGHVWPCLDFRMRGLGEFSICCDPLTFMLPLPHCHSNLGDALSSSREPSTTLWDLLTGERGPTWDQAKQCQAAVVLPPSKGSSLNLHLD